MKNLSIAFLAAVSLVSFAGCKGKKGDMMAKMTEYKEQMCKCTDKACADKVVAEMAKGMEAEGKEGKTPDPEEQKKYEPIMKQYAECMAKANGMGAMGGAPAGGEKPADPAAPPPAAPPAGDKPAGDKPPGAN